MASTGGISGIGLTTLAGGSILLWSAIKGKAWSETLRSLIKGEQPSQTQDYPIDVPQPATVDNPGLDGPIQNSGAGLTRTQNMMTGRMLAATYGWGTGENWDSLVKMWDKESNWSNTADNPTSDAYGIPQALPYTKMPKAAWPTKNGGSSSAVAQIKWGLDYIKQRYGTPAKAWAFWQINHWY